MSFFYRRKQLLITATLLGALIKLVSIYAKRWLTRAAEQSWSSTWEGRLLYTRLVRYRYSQRAMESHTCLPPGVLVQKTVTLSLFFFQAEDGIRDLYVTGVQTCALPI